MEQNPKRLLELFPGTGSVGKPWRAAGHDVVSVDIDNKYQPEVCEDILTWNYQSQCCFDTVWASVPCEQYSICRTRAKTPRNYKLADSLVAKTIEIIKYFQNLNPELAWFVENPDSSQLWSRAVAWDLYPRVRLDYCCYNEPGYRKKTKIATNIQWTPRALCIPHSCPSCVNGIHKMSAQRGYGKGKDKILDNCSLDLLHHIPRDLCVENLGNLCRLIFLKEMMTTIFNVVLH